MAGESSQCLNEGIRNPSFRSVRQPVEEQASAGFLVLGDSSLGAASDFKQGEFEEDADRVHP
jgi:hypothetical protein